MNSVLLIDVPIIVSPIEQSVRLFLNKSKQTDFTTCLLHSGQLLTNSLEILASELKSNAAVTADKFFTKACIFLSSNRQCISISNQKKKKKKKGKEYQFKQEVEKEK